MNRPALLPQLARLVLRPAQWDAAADACARFLPSDSPADHAASLRSQVKRGRAKVCTLERGGEKRGFIVFKATRRHELVILAAFGRDSRVNLLGEIVALADVLARQCECSSVRFHTMRPGLIVQAQAHGYHVSEVVMRKAVK